jgi:hypothetical protein
MRGENDQKNKASIYVAFKNLLVGNLRELP